MPDKMTESTSYFKSIISDTRSFSYSQLFKFIYLFAFIVYGFEIFNFNLSIDEELVSVIQAPSKSWILEGRWGMYILHKFVLPFPALPVVPIVLAILFYGLGIVLILRFWQPVVRIQHFIAGAMAFAFPSLIYAFTFSTLNYGIGIGMALVGGGLILHPQKNFMSKGLAVLMFTLSIAIYQSFLLVILCAYLFYLALRVVQNGNIEIEESKNSYKILEFLFVIVLSLIIYFLIQKIFMFGFGLKPGGYVDQFFQPTYFMSHMAEVLKKTCTFMVWVFVSGTAYRSDLPMCLPTLSISSLVIIGIAALARPLKFSLRISFVALIAAGLFIPFSMHLMSKGEVPFRSLISLPIAIGGLIFVSIHLTKGWMRIVMIILASAAIYQCSVIAIRFESSTHLALQADRILAGRLIERIDQEMVKSANPPKYLDIVGNHQWPESRLMTRRSVLGMSFFEWVEIGSDRAVCFLKTLGFNKLEPASIEKRASLVMIARDMPLWPGPGCVRAEGDTVIVKFSDYTDYQKKQICTEQNIRDFCPS